ncbi:hypothetical protein VC83_00311 [Pseudogymnoascus destructans]|uniref:Uncharacterized protein n=2 Tax=Pseudogymnoascus destructans TaxID=655981 RepID=L8G6K9_PSED2|nr:uncharacterized protein VC83_00311 [Pseudogymnoascus destructans]ELR08742.1 hypothetical protein GMDG_03421 [Pseudogymnoascus destructans 20631-21]OAF63105.1 hypothetical protein VC83_00311 [Pseudogymnoascus destructans]
MAASPGAAGAFSVEAANQLACDQSASPSAPAPAFSAPASVSSAPSAVSSVIRACVRLLRAAKSGRGRKRAAGPTRIETWWRVEVLE